MPMTETRFNDAVPVEGYGPGFFRAAGTVHHGPVLVWATGVSAWGGYEDLAPLLALAGEVDVIFVGTGETMTYLPKPFREALEAVGLGVEPMASPAAARSYNVLLGEGRRVVAALLPIDATQ